MLLKRQKTRAEQYIAEKENRRSTILHSSHHKTRAKCLGNSVILFHPKKIVHYRKYSQIHKPYLNAQPITNQIPIKYHQYMQQPLQNINIKTLKREVEALEKDYFEGKIQNLFSNKEIPKRKVQILLEKYLKEGQGQKVATKIIPFKKYKNSAIKQPLVATQNHKQTKDNIMLDKTIQFNPNSKRQQSRQLSPEYTNIYKIMIE